MAKKKDKGPGCLMYLFFMAVLASLVTYIFISNTFSFKTMLSYGPSQYFANIWHFHKDYYCQSKTTQNIYKEILPPESLAKKDKNKVITTLQPGKRFKLKGYRTKEYVTWVAVKVADGSDVIYGYLMVPDKIDIPTVWATVNRLQETFLDSPPEPFSNKYFSEIPSKSIEQYRNNLLGALKTKLGQTVKLKKTTQPAEMQKIKDSKDFRIIDDISSDTVVYYCPKSEYEKAEALYDAYLGSGFDTHYVQVAHAYDPGKDGAFKQGIFLRIVDTWYFKVFIGLVLFCIIRRMCKGPKSSPSDNDTEQSPSTSKPKNANGSASIDLATKMRVKNLKDQFRKAFGCQIRVYTTPSTKRQVKDDIQLGDLRDVKGPLQALTIAPSATVDQVEQRFGELGIGIQVMNADGKTLAPNDAKLKDL